MTLDEIREVTIAIGNTTPYDVDNVFVTVMDILDQHPEYLLDSHFIGVLSETAKSLEGR